MSLPIIYVRLVCGDLDASEEEFPTVSAYIREADAKLDDAEYAAYKPDNYHQLTYKQFVPRCATCKHRKSEGDDDDSWYVCKFLNDEGEDTFPYALQDGTGFCHRHEAKE